jgi:hypothetical protein
MSSKSYLTEAILDANGFQKGVKENGFTLFSKRIPGTISDFIIMKGEDGLFYAPQIHTLGIPNDMIALPNQENILSVDEVNFYFQKATRKLRS